MRRELDRGNRQGIANVELTSEHPVLVKFLYRLTIDANELDEFPTTIERFKRYEVPDNSLRRARYLS